MRSSILMMCVLSVGMQVCATATADDVLAPGWRGKPRTVKAEWDTFIGHPGMPADSVVAPGLNDPTAYLDGTGTDRLTEYEGRTNVLHLDPADALNFTMDNFSNGVVKHLWMQVTYYGDAFCAPRIQLLSTGTMGGPEYIDTIPKGDDPASKKWRTEVFSWSIRPNPPFETFNLWFADINDNRLESYVDQIVVDTICVPEPATLGLLALGCLAVLHWRR